MDAVAQRHLPDLADDWTSATPIRSWRSQNRQYPVSHGSRRGRRRKITTLAYQSCVHRDATSRRLHNWLNKDPIEEKGGVNLYNYVGNCPVNGFDPFGLWQITLGA